MTVPRGIPEGMSLRVAGHGQPGSVPGAPPGDLLVVVGTQPDWRFERRGADLWLRAEISLPDAVLGTKLDVPTIPGEAVVLNVPAGTQPNSLMRVRDKGLPIFGAADTVPSSSPSP